MEEDHTPRLKTSTHILQHEVVHLLLTSDWLINRDLRLHSHPAVI